MPIRNFSKSSLNKTIKSTIKGNILSLFCILLLAGGLWAIRITVTGSWTEYIDEADLQGPPGSDLISSYESASDQVLVSIDARWWEIWQVSMRKIDSNWHADFTLYARRTSSGTGMGGVNGGTSYLDIRNTNRSFFSGWGDRNNIDIQYRLEGVSINIEPGIYTTTIIYTVTTWR